MSTKFKNPPINELVIGVYFDREVSSLRSEHIGLFWGQMRKDFPTIQQQPTVIRPALEMATSQQIALQFFPMPRFWLESSDGSTLMQIQKNAFLFNWRKRNSTYPHFDVVKDAFDENKKLFFHFLSEELNEPAPNPQLAELTYINLIERCEYWSGPHDTSKVIPRFQLPLCECDEMEPSDFQQITIQRLAPDLSINVGVRSARSALNPTEPVLVIEYRATGLLPDPDKLDKWFDRAHEAIGNCFTSMTSRDIQTSYWKPM